jgi:hypothetical protein
MKKLFLALWLAGSCVAAHAADIATVGNYAGPIQGVALGFFSSVGVGLPSGQTCHGKNVVVLLTTHPRYKEILAAMLAAEAGNRNVRFNQIGGVVETFSPGYTYCVIGEAAIGDFPLW